MLENYLKDYLKITSQKISLIMLECELNFVWRNLQTKLYVKFSRRKNFDYQAKAFHINKIVVFFNVRLNI